MQLSRTQPWVRGAVVMPLGAVLIAGCLCITAAPAWPADQDAPIAAPALPADAVGRSAPEWEDLEWVHGGPLRLEALRGKVVLVRWWTAPGCSLCTISAPALRRLHDELGPRGLVVVGLFHDKSPKLLTAEEVRAAARGLGFEFPLAIDAGWRNLKRWWLDAGPRRYTSVSFLLDQAGVVRHVHRGGAFSLEESAAFPDAQRDYAALRAEIEKLLPPEPPGGWRPEAPRDEIAPRTWVEAVHDGGYLLGMAGRGSDAVDGRWVRAADAAAGKLYRFTALHRARGIDTPERSVLARVVWTGKNGEQLGQPEYPLTGRVHNGWTGVEGVYQAPEGAAGARLELHLRWTASGEVLWRDVLWREAAPLPGRKVRLASVNHRPSGSPSPAANVEAFTRLLDEAARRQADILCLPEGITVVGTREKYADVAEAVPGPTTQLLGRAAAKHKMWLVAGLYERDGPAIYNTSVLLDRDGRLAGKYRKVCLPREEIDGGITPGKEYPVFDTDFGRVGMMICWDVHFPEVARELAARGAEVILLPIWGGNETLARARAIENQVYLIASGYDFHTAIYDKRGEPLARSSRDPEVIVAEVDLDARLLWPWLGDWRARIWREAPAGKER